MKIFITTHGQYEDNHVSLCTTDFEKAVRHFLDYSKKSWYNSMGNLDMSWYNSMGNLDIWENDEEYHCYGSKCDDIINTKKKEDLTFEDIREDILKSLGKSNKAL